MEKKKSNSLEAKIKNAAELIFEKVVLPYETNLDNKSEYKRGYYKIISSLGNSSIKILSYIEKGIETLRTDFEKIFKKTKIKEKKRYFDYNQPLYLDFNGNITAKINRNI